MDENLQHDAKYKKPTTKTTYSMITFIRNPRKGKTIEQNAGPWGPRAGNGGL